MPARIFHATPTLGRSIGDINHEWVECHRQWNPMGNGRGKNDGFIIEHLRDRGELMLGSEWNECDDKNNNCTGDAASPSRFLCGGLMSFIKSGESNRETCGHPDSPMAIYKRADTPVYHSFIDNFTLCDAWHASVMGPTWPNRFYVHSASSAGSIASKPRSRLDTIWNVLRDAGLNAVNFFADVPLNYAMYGREDTVDYDNPNSGSALVFDGGSPLRSLFKIRGAKVALAEAAEKRATDKTFEQRCKDGDLPPVSYIEPPYFSADDHPPHDILLGQAFVKAVYQMLYGGKANRDQANKTLLLVIYDEHGSFFDHQDPGAAYEASSAPMDSDERFRPLGFRVPAMIVGPMVKRAYVSHTVYDHSSVLSTITRWARLKGHNLRDFQPVRYDEVTYDPNRRVRIAKDIGDCLDLSYDGRGREMPALPAISVREVDALAGMYQNEGQRGFADRYGVEQPTVGEKMDACKQVMEHLYRLGAVNIG